jgi:hypothetical protein
VATKPSQTNSKNPTHPFTSPLCTVSAPSKQSGYEQKHCWQMCRIPSHTSPQQNPNRNEPQTKAKEKKRKKAQKKKSLFLTKEIHNLLQQYFKTH